MRQQRIFIARITERDSGTKTKHSFKVAKKTHEAYTKENGKADIKMDEHGHDDVPIELEELLRQHSGRCRGHPRKSSSGNLRVCYRCCPFCKLVEEADWAAEDEEDESYTDLGSENVWRLML